MKKTKKPRQILALFLVAALCFAVAFSFSGLIVSAHHNCTEPHCAICERAMLLKTTLSFAAVPLLIFAVVKIFLILREDFTAAAVLLGCTGVRLKTRLNN